MWKLMEIAALATRGSHRARGEGVALTRGTEGHSGSGGPTRPDQAARRLVGSPTPSEGQAGPGFPASRFPVPPENENFAPKVGARSARRRGLEARCGHGVGVGWPRAASQTHCREPGIATGAGRRAGRAGLAGLLSVGVGFFRCRDADPTASPASPGRLGAATPRTPSPSRDLASRQTADQRQPGEPRP